MLKPTSGAERRGFLTQLHWGQSSKKQPLERQNFCSLYVAPSLNYEEPQDGTKTTTPKREVRSFRTTLVISQ